MLFMFYFSALIAVLATAMVLISVNAVHALLYLIVSLLALALALFILGAPFAAALEVIIYAGAIVVLFVFVVMMLNLRSDHMEHDRIWLRPRVWLGPSVLAALLLIELTVVLVSGGNESGSRVIGAKEVGIALFGPYVLAVELASMLLLAALVGAYHLGRQVRAESK